jgi:hypothetical protein
MKTLLLLVALLPLVFAGCGMVTRDVTTAALEQRLAADSAKPRPALFWYYIGSDERHHYFRRQVGRVFHSESADGIYRIRRDAMALEQVEFPLEERNSPRWKSAFTERDKNGMPTSYDLRFGVDKSKNEK